MICICTNKELTNALAYVNMSTESIPRAHRRKRNDKEYQSLLEYFSKLKSSTGLEGVNEIPVGAPVRIVYNCSVNFGTRKWSDIRKSYYMTGIVNIYKITDKSVCFTDVYGNKKHMLIATMIAVVVDPA